MNDLFDKDVEENASINDNIEKSPDEVVDTARLTATNTRNTLLNTPSEQHQEESRIISDATNPDVDIFDALGDYGNPVESNSDSPSREIGFGEKLRLGAQADTGETFSTGEAVAMRMIPFASPVKKTESNNRIKMLEEIIDGIGFEDINAISPSVIKKYGWEDGSKSADEAKERRLEMYFNYALGDAARSFSKTKEYQELSPDQKLRALRPYAEQDLIDITKKKQTAQKTLSNTTQGTLSKIGTGIVENTGDTLEFVFGTVLAGGHPAGGFAVAGTASALERGSTLATNDYEIDERGELVNLNNALGETEAALQGIVGGFTEAGVETALGWGVGKLGGVVVKGIAKVPGAKYIGNNVSKLAQVTKGKLSHVPGAQMLAKLGRGYSSLSHITGQHEIPMELLEENVQSFFDDVVGLAAKKGEYEGFGKEWENYKRDTLNWDTQRDILLGMVGTMVLQGAGGAYLDKRRRAPGEKKVADAANKKAVHYSPKEARGRLELLGFGDKLNSLSDSQAVFLANLSHTMEKFTPEELLEILSRQDARVRNMADEIRKKYSWEYDQQLAENGESAEFTPDNNSNGLVNTLPGEYTDDNGNKREARVILDTTHGVGIRDNMTDEGDAFTVKDNRGNEIGVSSMQSALIAANMLVKQNAVKNAENKQKAEYISQIIAQNYGTDAQNKFQLRNTWTEFIDEMRANGASEDTIRRFRQEQKKGTPAVRLDDGRVFLFLDNVTSPIEAAEVLQHEVIGHDSVINKLGGKEGVVKFLRSLDSKTMRDYTAVIVNQMKQRMLNHLKRQGVTITPELEAQIEQEAMKFSTTDEGIQEIFARIVERRRHNPAIWQKLAHRMRERAREKGANKPINDNDLEVILSQMEKESGKVSFTGQISVVPSMSVGGMTFLRFEENTAPETDADVDDMEGGDTTISDADYNSMVSAVSNLMTARDGATPSQSKVSEAVGQILGAESWDEAAQILTSLGNVDEATYNLFKRAYGAEGGASETGNGTAQTPAQSEQASRVASPAGEAAGSVEAGEAPTKVGGTIIPDELRGRLDVDVAGYEAWLAANGLTDSEENKQKFAEVIFQLQPRELANGVRLVTEDSINDLSLDFDDNYYYVHRTSGDAANQISENGFKFGADIAGTAALVTSEEQLRQMFEIQRQADREQNWSNAVHGGSHAVIIAIPKSEVMRVYPNAQQLRANQIADAFFDVYQGYVPVENLSGVIAITPFSIESTTTPAAKSSTSAPGGKASGEVNTKGEIEKLYKKDSSRSVRGDRISDVAARNWSDLDAMEVGESITTADGRKFTKTAAKGETDAVWKGEDGKTIKQLALAETAGDLAEVRAKEESARREKEERVQQRAKALQKANKLRAGLYQRFINEWQLNPNSIFAYWHSMGGKLFEMPETDKKGRFINDPAADTLNNFFDGLKGAQREMWKNRIFGYERNGSSSRGNDVVSEEVARHTNNEELVNNYDEILDTFLNEYEEFLKWKQSGAVSREEREAADRAEAEEAAEREFYLGELADKEVADKEYNNAFVEVEKYDNGHPFIKMFSAKELSKLQEGDTIRFDHADIEWVVVSYDKKRGILTVKEPNWVAEERAFSEGTDLMPPKEMRYVITKNGISEYKEKEKPNEPEDKRGTSKDVNGDEQGKRGESTPAKDKADNGNEVVFETKDGKKERVEGYVKPTDDIKVGDEVVLQHDTGGSINARQKIFGTVTDINAEGGRIKVDYKDPWGYAQDVRVKPNEIIGIKPTKADADKKTTIETSKTEQKVPKTGIADKKTAREAEKAPTAAKEPSVKMKDEAAEKRAKEAEAKLAGLFSDPDYAIMGANEKKYNSYNGSQRVVDEHDLPFTSFLRSHNIVGLDRENGTPIEGGVLRDAFEAFETRETQRKLFRKVFDVAEKLGCTYRVAYSKSSDDKGELGYELGGRIVFHVDRLDRENNETIANTILHELIHGVTSYAIDISENQAGVEGVTLPTSLHNAVRKLRVAYKLSEPFIKGTYEASNIHEFVAGLSNPAFRRKLDQKNLLRRTLDAIVDIFRALFGRPTTTKEAVNSNRALKALHEFLKNFDRTAFETHRNAADEDASRANYAIDQNKRELFQKRAGAVMEIIEVYRDSGVAEFKTLATRMFEGYPDKFENMKSHLRGIWNYIAEQEGLDEVSKDEANRIYDSLETRNYDTISSNKEVKNEKRVDSDSGTGSGRDNVDRSDEGISPVGSETVSGLPSGGRVRGSDSDERVDGIESGGLPGLLQESSDSESQKEQSSRNGETAGEHEPVGNRVGHEVGESLPGRDSAKDGADGSSRPSGRRSGRGRVTQSIKNAANEAANDAPGSADFVMTESVEEAILERSPIKRVHNNVAALKLLQELKSRDYKATPEEQKTLAKYVGWGGLSEIFTYEYDKLWQDEKRIAEGGKPYYDAEAILGRTKYGKEGYEAYKEIRSILNDEEFSSARATVLTAFYTPIPMVRAEHDALRKLGVMGGRVLGPSAGVGNYASAAGIYPKGLSWQFVEKDEVSGLILRALFPNQRVHIGGFQETKFPDGFYDLAIDNVPYADIDILDKSIGKKSFKIHDYFFAKTLSKLRPGGVMMFLTSTGTLDKTDGKLRQFLSQNGGKIIGAVRLPNGFFSKNAGTDVASDLVVIQRQSGIVDNSGFMNQVKYGEEGYGKNKTDLTYNEYFKEHPEQVIGEMKASTGQYGRPVIDYKMPEGDLYEMVSAAIDRALEGVDKELLLKNTSKAVRKDHAPIYDDEGLRQGNITIKDGKVYEKNGEELIAVEMPRLKEAQKKALMKKYLTPMRVVEKVLAIRKAMRDVVDAEVYGVDDDTLAPRLAKLNELYDDFVKKVGTFHDKNIAPFVMLDKADGNRIMSLEKFEKVDGKTVIEKADIFKKRVIYVNQRPTKADSTDDALIISYGETGAIDIERIAGLLGLSEADAIERMKSEGKIFENPQTGLFEPYWEYLSGHVRRKLSAAKAAAESDKSFARNVEELEKVQPADISLDVVDIKFGAPWVDADAMVDFLYESYGLGRYYTVKVNRNEITGKWNVELPRTDVQPFGATAFSQEKFLNSVLNAKSLDVTVKDPVDGKHYKDERKSEAQNLAAEKLHAAFARFVRTNEKWFAPSGEAFNLAMNDNVPMILPKNILPLRESGMNEDFIKKLHAEGREYQPAVIARGVFGGKSLCLAHCVGAGKTLEMQTIGMVGRHLGMFNKSMYVVPNHMLDQFCNEFLAAFPNANLLKMSSEDVKPQNRRAFFAKASNGDWDAIVVKHSTFSMKLPLTPELQKQYLQQEINRLTEAKLAAKGEKGTVKDIEKLIAKSEDKIKKLDNSESKDDNIVPFEELGVDQLFVDEAHNFKGLPVVSTQARNTKGLQQGDSQRALDMEMKVTYIQSLHGGKRGVVFATGTPLSNAPVVEAYVMLRYLAPYALEEQNIKNFDDFVSTFGRIETESEFDPSGKTTKEVQRVSAFVNIPEMMRLFKSVVDIVNSDQIKVKRPKMKLEAVPVPMSTMQEKVMEMVSKESAIPPTKEEKSKYLTLTSIAKRACTDPHLVGIDEDGYKLVACAQKVKEVYDETSDVRGAQLVFCDMFNTSDAEGTEKYIATLGDVKKGKKSWNLYKSLKDKLVAQGIPANEIGIINDIDKAKGGEEGKDAAKEEMFEKVRSGEIRILLGSRLRMGEGTNVQERLAAIHLLHPGWKPAEDTQAIGRIIRPGNMFETGKVFYYITQGNKNIGSYETKNHELVGIKSRLIEAIMHGDETIREMGLDESAVERDMLMGLATANKDLIKLIDVRRVLRKAELNAESVLFSARSNSDKAERAENQLEKMREEYADMEEGAKVWRQSNPNGSFVLTTADGRTLDTMKDMSGYVSAQVVKQLAKDRYDRDERLEIGSFGGVPLILTTNFADNKIHLAVPSVGYAREIAYSGFLPDFTISAMTAFKGAILNRTSADIEESHKLAIEDVEKRIAKLKADAKSFADEWESEKERLKSLRSERMMLERKVTPLIVEATNDRRYVSYGNWWIEKDIVSLTDNYDYTAVRETDGKRLTAPTVKDLLPLIDAEDFELPGNAATKTAALLPNLRANRNGEKPAVDTMTVEEVNFADPDYKIGGDDTKLRNPTQYDIFSRRGDEDARQYIERIKATYPTAARLAGGNRQLFAILGYSPDGRQFAGLQDTSSRNAAIYRQTGRYGASRGARANDSSRSSKVYERDGLEGSLRGDGFIRTENGVIKRNYTTTDFYYPITSGDEIDEVLIRRLFLNLELFGEELGVKRIKGFTRGADGDIYAIVESGMINPEVNPSVRSYFESRGYSYGNMSSGFDGNGPAYYTRNGYEVGGENLKFVQNSKTKAIVPVFADIDDRGNVKKYNDSLKRRPLQGSLFADPDYKIDGNGITNAEQDAAQIERGLKAPKKRYRGDEAVMRGAEEIRSNAEFTDTLARVLKKNPRAILAEENIALAQEWLKAKDEYDDIVYSIAEATRSGDTAAVRKMNARKRELEGRMATIIEAREKGVGEAARTLRTNRFLFKSDYSLAGLVAQATADLGRPLTDIEYTELKDIADKLAKFDEQERDMLIARIKAYADKAIKDMIAQDKVDSIGKPRTTNEMRRMLRKRNDALAQIEVLAFELGGEINALIPTGEDEDFESAKFLNLRKYLRGLAQYHVYHNPNITEQELIAALIEDIAPYFTVDADTVRQIFSGYGHSWNVDRTEIQRKVSDLSAQSRILQQIADYKAGELAKLTGPQRSEPSDEVRELTKIRDQLRRQMEREGKFNDQGKHLKTLLDSAKTRYTNMINDIKAALDAGVQLQKREPLNVSDAELDALKAEYAKLKEEYDAIWGSGSKMTDEQKRQMVEKGLKRALERWVDKLERAQRGDFSSDLKAPKVTSADIEALRKKIEEHAEEWRRLKAARSIEEWSDEELLAYAQRRLEAVNRALKHWQTVAITGDIAPRKKKDIPFPNDAMRDEYERIQEQRNRAYRQILDMREHLKNKETPLGLGYAKEYAQFVSNFMRSLLATADFSAMMRQTAPMTMAHPLRAVKTLFKTFGAMMSSSKAMEIDKELRNNPLIREALNNKWLEWRALEGSGGSDDVEMFHGIDAQAITIGKKKDGTERRIALGDIKGLGTVLHASERQYATFINMFSADLYIKMCNSPIYGKNGPTDAQKQMIAAAINMSNGSAQLGAKGKQAMAMLTQVFWAPKLAVSRAQVAVGGNILYPFLSGKKNDATTKERGIVSAQMAFESIRAWLGAAAAGWLMLSLFGDDDEKEYVEQAEGMSQLLMTMRPRIGSTKLDFTGGVAQWWQLMQMAVTGVKETATGKKIDLANTYGRSKSGELWRFLQGKLNPFWSNTIALWEEKDFVGRDFGWGELLENSAIPLAGRDIWDAATNDNNGLGRGLLMAPFILIGAGGTTYDIDRSKGASNKSQKSDYDVVRSEVNKNRDKKVSTTTELLAKRRVERLFERAHDTEQIIKRREKKGLQVPQSLRDRLERQKAEALEAFRSSR